MSYHLSRFAKTIASYLDIFMTAAQTISCRHKSDFNYRTCSSFLFLLCLLLFGTPSRSLAVDYNRSWRTVMGFYPRPGSLAAALIAWSPGQRGLWLDGSIMIGSSGRCGMPCHRPFSEQILLALHLWCHLIDRILEILQVVFAYLSAPLFAFALNS